MGRFLSQAIFLIVAVLVVGGAHRYLWARLVRDPQLPAPWGKVATVFIVAMAIGVFAAPISARLLNYPHSRLVSAAAFTWVGAMFLLLLMLFAVDLVRLGQHLWTRWAAAESSMDPNRRLFLARLFGTAAAAGAATLTGTAVRAATRTPSVVEVDVPLARLPAALDGFRIVQITDLHVSATIRRNYVASVVELVNGLKPDLVAVTGDLVDGSVDMLREHTAPLGDLRSTHGTFFVTGNHEYYSGVESWLAETSRLGMRNLRNERVTIGVGPDSFDLAGVDDATAHRFGNGHGADMARAVSGRDQTRELVLLAHQPKAIYDAAPLGTGLVISGHTHGGQIWPWAHLVRLSQPYVSGLHRHDDTWIYVSRGTGYWGPPMRLAAPHEVTVIRLRRAD